MKIVFLDAATMGSTPLTEIEKLGELTTYDSSTAEEAREWILKRRHREDIRQGSWRVERQ